MLTKDIAICIRAVDYSETSQIVTFFTKGNGKIGAIAKGSKRPRSAFDGPIEIFSHGRIVFADSNKDKLATLTEFESAYGGPGFRGLRNNLFALNCCLFGAELLDKLTNEYDPHPGLFDSFLQFLQDANEGRETLALLILFQLALLKEVGLQPILNHCVNCKSRYEGRGTGDETNWAESYFSSSANGLICRDCEPNFPDKVGLSQAGTNCLGNLKLVAGEEEDTLREIEKVLIYHFTELTGRRPKMAKYVLKQHTLP